MTTLETYIRSYCNSPESYRPNLERPTLIGDYVFASDGQRAIRVKSSDIDFEVYPNPEFPNIVSVWESVLQNQRVEIDIALIQNAFESLPLTPKTVDCPDCDGSGEIECYHCGHEEDCENCNGKGYLIIAGEMVQDVEDVKFELNSAYYNPLYLNELVKAAEMQGLKIIVCESAHEEQANIFTIGTIQVLLMPCNKRGLVADEEKVVSLNNPAPSAERPV